MAGKKKLDKEQAIAQAQKSAASKVKTLEMPKGDEVEKSMKAAEKERAAAKKAEESK